MYIWSKKVKNSWYKLIGFVQNITNISIPNSVSQIVNLLEKISICLEFCDQKFFGQNIITFCKK